MVQAISIEFAYSNRGPCGEDRAFWRAIRRRNNIEIILASGFVSYTGRARFSMSPFNYSCYAKDDLLWSVEQDFKRKHHSLKKILRKKALDRVWL